MQRSYAADEMNTLQTWSVVTESLFRVGSVHVDVDMQPVQEGAGAVVVQHDVLGG